MNRRIAVWRPNSTRSISQVPSGSTWLPREGESRGEGERRRRRGRRKENSSSHNFSESSRNVLVQHAIETQQTQDARPSKLLPDLLRLISFQLPTPKQPRERSVPTTYELKRTPQKERAQADLPSLNLLRLELQLLRKLGSSFQSFGVPLLLLRARFSLDSSW